VQSFEEWLGHPTIGPGLASPMAKACLAHMLERGSQVAANYSTLRRQLSEYSGQQFRPSQVRSCCVGGARQDRG
jgi:hypothetical protein